MLMKNSTQQDSHHVKVKAVQVSEQRVYSGSFLKPEAFLRYIK